MDIFFVPFAGVSPFWGLFAMSAVTGVLMVIVYKYTSNQAGIARAKERIKGHLLETWIYREQVSVMLRAQRKVLKENLVYMGLNLKPLAAMMIPVLLILIDLNFRFGMAPIPPGATTIIIATREKAVAVDEMDESIALPHGLRLDGPPVRVESKGETYWKVGVAAPGRYMLKITSGGKVYEKSLDAGSQGIRVAPLRSVSVEDAIFYPGEPAMPSGGTLESIEVIYPSQSPEIPWTNWRPHWIIQYFVLSIIFGFIVKGPLKVEI